MVRVADAEVGSGRADRANTGSGDSSEAWGELSRLEARLSTHFADLRASRSPTVPIFAIEHGLSSGEIDLLQSAVRRAVLDRRSFRSVPLPLLVYATEVGYGYDGGEYWQTFSAETPGWAEHGNRSALRDHFARFARDQGGFRPTGPWARTFSIISWPISHAMLPRVYQRQLAQLLFELRTRLTRELVADPVRLGQFIAANAWDASERFQQQAANHAVIGQVARSLLVADLPEEETGLLESTVERITADLSQERDAKRWLQAAQRQSQTAFATGQKSSARRSERVGEVDLALDPTLILRNRSGEWRLTVGLPDFRPLAETQPDLLDALATKRVRVAGVQAPLARRTLLFAGASCELIEEVPFSQSLLSFERPDDSDNALLSPYCRLGEGPLLFRVHEDEGVLVKARQTRPGGHYLLLSTDPLEVNGIGWAATGDKVADLFVVDMLLPGEMTPPDLNHLSRLGLSAHTRVRLEPAGLANFGWDGENVATWPEHQEVAFAVSSDRRLSSLIISVGTDAFRLGVDGERTLFSLGRPPVGNSEVRVEAFEADNQAAIATTTFHVSIKSAQRRSLSGSQREALSLEFTPPTPRFVEIQNGETSVAIIGPSGIRVDARVELRQRNSSNPLASISRRLVLPVSEQAGRSFIGAALRDEEMGRQFERADVIEVSARHPELGLVSSTLDREFVPLRWIVTPSQDEIFADLVDNVDNRLPVVGFYSAQAPDTRISLPYQPGESIRIDEPGLLVAQIDDLLAAIVVTPSRLLTFADLGGHGANARVSQERATASRLRELVGIASIWQVATKPRFDATLTSRRVRRAIAAEIGASVGGRDWAHVEHEHRDRGHCPAARVTAALGTSRNAQRARDALHQRLPRPAAVELTDLVRTFAAVCSMVVTTRQIETIGLSAFCLQLASAPSTLTSLPRDDFEAMALKVIENPILLRLARSLIFLINEESEADFESDAPYEGLDWR